METRFSYIWYDQWHPDGRLLDKYSYRAMYDARSNVGARVSSIIRDGDWFWPAARSNNIVQIQSRLPEVQISEADLPIWNSKNGIYSCAETWELLREKKKKTNLKSSGFLWHSSPFLHTLIGV